MAFVLFCRASRCQRNRKKPRPLDRRPWYLVHDAVCFRFPCLIIMWNDVEQNALFGHVRCSECTSNECTVSEIINNIIINLYFRLVVHSGTRP